MQVISHCPRCQQPLKTTASQYCPNCHVLLANYPQDQSGAEEPETEEITDTMFQPLAAPVAAISLDQFFSFVRKDTGFWSLLLANMVTLLIALYEGWALQFVMSIYAAQSILIGIGTVVRILNLQRFSVKGFKINGRPASETRADKVQVAIFFCFHYGIFHAGYLFFLGTQYDLDNLPALTILLCSGIFALQQWLSVRDDIREDAGRKPNLGTLMFLPYARIIPMHLTIIFGSQIAASTGALLLFLLLKVGADLLMYVVELYAVYEKERQLPG